MTAPYRLHAPSEQTAPLVFVSAHSGSLYPPAFTQSSRLAFPALRRSEDFSIDALFAAAPSLGAPLLAATLPRAWLDLNREPWELDPQMFADALPPWVNTASTRVQAGLGTIPRVVGSNEAIYRERLPWSEAEHRVRTVWHPFHAELAALITQTQQRFGSCLVIDCHSMPSTATSRSGARLHADIVLGDAFGTSCTQATILRVEALLADLGYRTARNDPYAGGHITRQYGRPHLGVETLQIELARRLYMDEERIEPTPGFAVLENHLTQFIRTLAAGP